MEYTDVDFRYILKSNFEVEISGRVSVPLCEDADDDDFEITFEKEDGFTTPHLYIQHSGVELTQRYRTDKQDFEIDKLKELFTGDFMFLTRICDNMETNRIIDLDEAYLVINGTDFETVMGVH